MNNSPSIFQNSSDYEDDAISTLSYQHSDRMIDSDDDFLKYHQQDTDTSETNQNETHQLLNDQNHAVELVKSMKRTQHQMLFPPELCQRILSQAGCKIERSELLNLVSLSTQHFLHLLLMDCKQLIQLRQSNSLNKSDLSSSSLLENELKFKDVATAIELATGTKATCGAQYLE